MWWVVYGLGEVVYGVMWFLVVVVEDVGGWVCGVWICGCY